MFRLFLHRGEAELRITCDAKKIIKNKPKKMKNVEKKIAEPKISNVSMKDT